MYRRGNKNKIITSLVLVAVLAISIGYATFTNTLKINSGAIVIPDSATFDIDFSSSSNSVVTDNITPVLTPSTLDAKSAVIDNSASPTITNLSVDFTEPGQKAVYSFYAYNNGEFLAYLNSINFVNPEGETSFITCEGEAGTSYVEDACKGINVIISVGGLETNETLENIHGHKLEKQTAEEVIVTIEYNEVENRADGPVNVKFGDITLVYTTIDSEGPIACTYDGELVQGAEYVNGQYTYRYKQQGTASDWQNINNDGWGVKLTDATSTDAVTTPLCSTINDKPIVSMSYMFSKTQATSIDVSSFDTSNVTSMVGMFAYSEAKEIIGLPNLDTSKVTDMYTIFHASTATSIDITGWNTSNVTRMSYMFGSAKATEVIGLTSLDTENVTLMQSMFSWTKFSELDLSSFDTKKVTTMANMFEGCNVATLDLSSFEVSSETTLTDMFSSTKATTGYARTEAEATRFNDSSVTGIPSTLVFEVK